jgi:hypothetical protein
MSTVPDTIWPELSRTTLASMSPVPRVVLLMAGTSLEGSITTRKMAVSAVAHHAAVDIRSRQTQSFPMALPDSQ